MTSIIQDFKIFQTNFPRLLDASGYKMDFLAKRLGMHPSTFANKKKRNSFDLDEMQALIDIVWNDYLEDISLTNAMILGEKEGRMTKAQTKALFKEWK